MRCVIFRLLIAGLVFPALILAPARAETGVSNDEILIGSCYAFNPALSRYGIEQVRGAKAYLNEVNSRGGIDGRKIKLLELDDADDSDKAIECFKKLMEANVFATAFFSGSAPGAKHVLMAERNAVPLLGLYVGARWVHEPFKRFVFTVRALFDDETTQMIDHLWNDLGVRKFGLIYQNDALGAASLTSIRQALTERGGQLTTASFERHTMDVRPAIERVRAADPEVVVLSGLYKPIAEILKESRNMKWRPIFYSMAKEPAILTEAGPSAEGLISATFMPWPDSAEGPGASEFLRLFKKYFPKDVPSPVSLEGFIDAKVLVQGLQKAGPDLTREKLVQALESLHDDDVGLGSAARIRFGPEQHKGSDHVYFYVVHSGRFTELRDWRALKKP